MYDERWTTGLVLWLFSGLHKRVGLYDTLGERTILKNERRLTCRYGDVYVSSEVQRAFFVAQNEELPNIGGPSSGLVV